MRKNLEFLDLARTKMLKGNSTHRRPDVSEVQHLQDRRTAGSGEVQLQLESSQRPDCMWGDDDKGE